MRCLQCERPAVGLCQVCLVAQCETHLAESLVSRRRSGALRGCSHEVSSRRSLDAGDAATAALSVPERRKGTLKR